MTATKGCWTCKDRKISCDRAAPVCLKCSKSKRACGGYGVRLSWPDQSKSKRALKDSLVARTKHVPTHRTYVPWINVFIDDVRLHVAATNADGNAWDHISRQQLSLPSFLGSTIRISEKMTSDELDLLHYFSSVVSHSLPMFGSNPRQLCDILGRMALKEDNRSANAVLLSVLALSSYHRGDLEYANQMKNLALRALIVSVDPKMDTNSAIKHIAAGLILCLVEIHQPPYYRPEWVGFVCGAKDVAQTIQQVKLLPGSDAAVILGWLYYFDVLARFTFRHWRTKRIEATAIGLGFEACTEECAIQYLIAITSFAREVPIISTFAHPVLELLAKVFETRLYSSDPEYHSIEYQQRLNNLSSQLENVDSLQLEQTPCKGDIVVAELIRLAALIYLERVSRNFSGQSAKLDSWIHSGQTILLDLDTLSSSFTLFIFGCEAHRDEDRLIILDLFTRLERKPHLQNLVAVKRLIETAWVQHDLEADGRLEYIHKLNLVLSSRDFIPSFF